MSPAMPMSAIRAGETRCACTLHRRAPRAIAGFAGAAIPAAPGRPAGRRRGAPARRPKKRRRRSASTEEAARGLARQPADQVGPVIDVLVEGADRQPLVAAVGALVRGDHRPGAVDAVDRHAAGAEIEAVRGARCSCRGRSRHWDGGRAPPPYRPRPRRARSGEASVGRATLDRLDRDIVGGPELRAASPARWPDRRPGRSGN